MKEQIEEMASIMCRQYNDGKCLVYGKCEDNCSFREDYKRLYNAGYRKQVVDANSATTTGEWKNNHCTNCGRMPMGEEMWTRLDLTPPRFEWFMNYCPNCGAKMKGGE